jgi:hypothetical protein
MIISNLPFMPTPDDSRHYYHSGGGGLLGMDFLETIFRQLEVLTHHLPEGFPIETIETMNKQLREQGITHQYIASFTTPRARRASTASGLLPIPPGIYPWSPAQQPQFHPDASSSLGAAVRERRFSLMNLMLIYLQGE